MSVPKILFPIGSLYPSQAGGPANSVYWLAKALTKTGAKLTIVTTDVGINGQVEFDRWLTTDYACQIIYLRTWSNHLPLRLIALALRLVPQTDIIHLTSLFHSPSLPLAFAARFWGKKILWSVHGELASEALKFNASLKLPYLWLIRKAFARRAIFHSTSAEETAQIKRIMGPHSQVVELPNYMEIPLQIQRQADNYLLYLGRIHPIKALEHLLSACAQSKSFREKNMRLLIAGDDQNEYGSKLKKLAKQLVISDKVVFLGHVEGQAKEQLLANAKWTLLVSRSENFGVSVIESLAQGTPVIASHGTPWQVLEKAQAGFWTDNQPEILAQTIDRALSLSDNDLLAYRARARVLAEEQFDIHANMEQWLDVYRSLQPTQSA